MKTQSIYRIIMITFSLAFMIAFYSSCKKDSKDDETAPPASESPDAFISGRVVSPTGKPIGSAEIIAGKFTTLSDKDGNFLLAIVHGNYNLVIQTGGGHVFKTELQVAVAVNQNLSLPETQTELKQTKNLAYVPGYYDLIEKLVIDTLGYNATMISIADFANLSNLTPYAAIFINCGALELAGPDHMDSAKYSNLASYMASLGSIYASDFAVECLTGDDNWKPLTAGYALSKMNEHKGGVSTMSTCISPLIGGFIADSSLCTSKSGMTGMVTNAHISDAGIINLLGKDSIDIYYDLGGWEIINNVEAPFTTIISDNNQGNGPLAVTTDFDDENPGGVIFYTSFHNHPQGIVNKDVQNILQYFILNL